MDILFTPKRPHAQHFEPDDAAALKAPSFGHVVAELSQLQVKHLEEQLPSEPIGLESDESYSLTVQSLSSGYAAELNAASSAGILRGLETFSQLTIRGDPEDPNIYINSTSVKIHDAPRFPWRGIMIDTSRHWQPVSSIEAMIDAISFNRMNVLQ
eukprot:SAG31_NODE_7766_length_1601_cov_5.037949_1_plen_155_part_00